jgi:hypothetical protein
VPDRALSSGSTEPSDPLNHFGRAVLTTDHRIVSGLYVLVLIAFVVVRSRTHRKPTLLDAIRVVLAMVTLTSGLIVICVFLLTKPPAVEALSSDVLSLVGLLTVIVTFGFGGRELAVSFFPPGPATPEREFPKEPGSSA